MLKKVWNAIVAGIKAIFRRETISKVWEILFACGRSAIGDLLANQELMDAAFAMSKALVDQDGSGEDKALAFETQLRTWAHDAGIDLGRSALNVIRETAYAAVKAEIEQANN